MLLFLASAHCLEAKPYRGSLNSLCRAPSPSGPPRPPAPLTPFCLRPSLETPTPALGSLRSPSLSSVASHCVLCILKPPPKTGLSSSSTLQFRRNWLPTSPLAFVSLDLLLLVSEPGFFFLRQKCFVQPQCPETDFFSSPSGASSWLPHTCRLYCETSPSSCCQERDFPMILRSCSPAAQNCSVGT